MRIPAQKLWREHMISTSLAVDFLQGGGSGSHDALPIFSGANVEAANMATARAIVGEPQNTAVIGHLCSSGFRSALPVYEYAGLTTIRGSASATDLPSLGPTVFNRTVVEDPNA